MKNDPNPFNSSPATGRRYWRSLDELAGTPEFKEWLHREFPQGASEMEDGPNRRQFLKIMSASFALAGLGLAGAGCRRPEEKLEPFGQQPADYVYGEPQYFATAMPTRTGAIPLVVKSYEGRPIKIEGNALYPGGNGGTDRYAQASILNLYDPDRAKRLPGRQDRFARGIVEISSRACRKSSRRIPAKVWRFSPKAALRHRERGCKKSSRTNFRSRSGSPTTRLIPASINARRRRRLASR